MKVDTDPIKLDTPLGALYVAVTTAKEDSFHDRGRGLVTELRPRLWVSTTPDFEADPHHAEHLTIRGRAYAVLRSFYFHDLSHITYDNGVNAGRWHRESAPHRGGYRTDRGAPVEFRTATYELIDDTVTAALDAFAAAHPQWGELSCYLLLISQHRSEQGTAAVLRSQAAEHEARAVELYREAEPLINALPEALTDLIR